jgi:hypothetical protein
MQDGRKALTAQDLSGLSANDLASLLANTLDDLDLTEQ